MKNKIIIVIYVIVVLVIFYLFKYFAYGIWLIPTWLLGYYLKVFGFYLSSLTLLLPLVIIILYTRGIIQYYSENQSNIKPPFLVLIIFYTIFSYFPVGTVMSYITCSVSGGISDVCGPNTVLTTVFGITFLLYLIITTIFIFELKKIKELTTKNKNTNLESVTN